MKTKKSLFWAVAIIVTVFVVGILNYANSNKRLDSKDISQNTANKDNSSPSKQDENNAAQNGKPSSNVDSADTDSNNQSDDESNSAKEGTSDTSTPGSNSSSNSSSSNGQNSSNSANQNNTGSGEQNNTGPEDTENPDSDEQGDDSSAILDSVLKNGGSYTGNVQLTKESTIYGSSSEENVTIIEGDVSITADKITFQNAKINGTIIVDPGSDGTVDLNNVVATNIEVKSGGEHSIHFNGVNVIESLTIDSTSFVRVESKGNTSIQKTTVNSGAILEALGGSMGDIEVSSKIEGQTIELRGNFDKAVAVNGNATINITATSDASSTSVPNLKINGQATVNAVESAKVLNLEISPLNNNTITLAGNFAESTITVAKAAVLNVSPNTTVSNIVVNTAVQISADSSASVAKVIIAPEKSTDNIVLGGKLNYVEIAKTAVITASQNAKLANVNIAPNNNDVVTLKGDFAFSKVEVSKPAAVTVAENTTVSSLQVGAKADVSIAANTSVSNIQVNTESNISLDKDATVSKIIQNTNNSTITGSGAENVEVVKNLLKVEHIGLIQSGTILKGGDIRLEIFAGNYEGPIDGVEYSYKSSNTDIVSVDLDGNITANAIGKAFITISTTNTEMPKTIQFDVEVVDAIDSLFSFTEGTQYILVNNVGAYNQLDTIPKLQGKYVEGVEFSYKSDNANVATVNEEGRIHAIAPGKVNITVSTVNLDNPKSVTYSFEVVSSIGGLHNMYEDKNGAINIVTSYPGETWNYLGFVATRDSGWYQPIFDEPNYNPMILGVGYQYTSDNPAVATVDEYQNVIAHSVGTANITVTTTNITPQISKVIKVTVLPPVSIKTIEGLDDMTVSLFDYNARINPVFKDENGNVVEGVLYELESDNWEVAGGSFGPELYLNNDGVAHITLRTINTVEPVSKTFTLTIEKNVDIDNIISNENITMILGGSVDLYSYGEKNGRPIFGAEFNYYSDNNEVVTVDNYGNVKAIGVGRANITVETTNSVNKISKQLEIQVVSTIDEIHVNPVMYVLQGSSIELHNNAAKDYMPVEGVTYSYSSNDDSVVTVDASNKLRGLREGTATITITTNNVEPAILKTATVHVVSDIAESHVSMFLENGFGFIDGLKLGLQSRPMHLNPYAIVDGVNPKDPINIVEGVTYDVVVDNPEIVEINEYNDLMPKAIGTANITFTPNNTKTKAAVTLRVEVTGNIQVAYVEGMYGNMVTVSRENPLKTVTINPVFKDAEGNVVENVGYIITSNDQHFVKAINGNEITINGPGYGHLYINTTNTEQPMKYTFSIYASETPDIDYISLNQPEQEIYILKNGYTTLHPDAFRDNHPIGGVYFEYESDNNDILTVDNNGTVTAHQSGTASVTIKSTNATVNKSAAVTVHVIDSLDDLYLNQQMYVIKGRTAELQAFAVKDGRQVYGVQYSVSSSNSSIAEISFENNIIGVNEGSTSVIVSTTNSAAPITREMSVTVVNGDVKTHIGVDLPNGIGFVTNNSLTMAVNGSPLHLHPYSTINDEDAYNFSKFIHGIEYNVFSDNPEVVGIDYGNNLIAKAKGTARITVTPIGSDNSVVLTVNVTDVVDVAAVDGLQELSAVLDETHPTASVSINPIFKNGAGEAVDGVSYLIVYNDSFAISSVNGTEINVTAPVNGPLALVTTNTSWPQGYEFEINVTDTRYQGQYPGEPVNYPEQPGDYQGEPGYYPEQPGSSYGIIENLQDMNVSIPGDGQYTTVEINPVFKDNEGNVLENVEYMITFDNPAIAYTPDKNHIQLNGAGIVHVYINTTNLGNVMHGSFTINVVSELVVSNNDQPVTNDITEPVQQPSDQVMSPSEQAAPPTEQIEVSSEPTDSSTEPVDAPSEATVVPAEQEVSSQTEGV